MARRQELFTLWLYWSAIVTASVNKVISSLSWLYFPNAKSAAFVMALMVPIRVFCPFWDLTSWDFIAVESWLEIEGFTFRVRKPLTFSGQGYLSSLALSFSSLIFSDKRLLKMALSFSSLIFSDKRLLKIAARPSRKGRRSLLAYC